MEIFNALEKFSATVEETVGLAAFEQLGGCGNSKLRLVRADEPVKLSWGGVHSGRGAYEEWARLLAGDEPAKIPGTEFSVSSSCNGTRGEQYLLPAGTIVLGFYRANGFTWGYGPDGGIEFHDTYTVYASITEEEFEAAMVAAQALLERRAAEAGEESPVRRTMPAAESFRRDNAGRSRRSNEPILELDGEALFSAQEAEIAALEALEPA